MAVTASSHQSIRTPSYHRWRLDLAIDWNGADLGYLGEDWFLSAEFIYGKKQDDVAWTDLSRRTLLDENGNPVTTSAGRPIYVADDPLDNHVPSEIVMITAPWLRPDAD